MNDREHILLIDDDRNVTESLAMVLEHPGRTTIVCSDIESAEIMLARYPITHILTDVQFSGTFGFEGLHFLERMHSLHECHIVLMTGNANKELRTAAMGFGAASVLAKPFTSDELSQALASTTTNDGPYEIVIVPNLDDILAGGLLTTAFQPIVCADGEGVHTYGFEALCRIRGGWPGGGPGELFDYAERRGRLADLNMAALTCAIHDAARLPASAVLFINIDPIVFHRPDFQPTLRAALAASGLPLSRLVLEITERSGFGEDVRGMKIFEELRADGARFALDDHGSAYSHLSAIDIIRPAFIKISQMFGTGFELDPTRTSIVHHVVALARQFGCRPVLEGIESPSTAVAAAAQGIELLQGYHFGRPSALPLQ
jgi:EAL domain-containing protein (putative c-di-GMP-specific phosphodiesterase class I)